MRYRTKHSVALLSCAYAKLGVEWQLAKYDFHLVAWREEVPQTILDGSGSATEWCLIKLQNPSTMQHYPLLSGVAEVTLALPVSTVWPERTVSILKWQKNRLRSKLKNNLLTSLLHISLNVSEMYSPTFRPLMQHVQAWLAEKGRKLLKESQSQSQSTRYLGNM